MVDEFCGSRFSFREKREIFFPDHPIVCRTCHKPRVKRLINLEDFSVRHQKLICMFGLPHGCVPAAGIIAAPAGGTPPAAAGTIAAQEHQLLLFLLVVVFLQFQFFMLAMTLILILFK